MGIVCSSEQVRRSRDIDLGIERVRISEMTTVKLLLLGTGECGKSTILKQVRILHDQNFGLAVKEAEKARIYSNIYHGMAALCEGVNALHITLSKSAELARWWRAIYEPTRTIFKSHAATIRKIIKANQDVQPISYEHMLVLKGWGLLIKPAARVKQIIKANQDVQPISYEHMLVLKELWKDQRIKIAYERRSDIELYTITDSVGYFLDNLERIYKKDYSPTNEDYLKLRIPTTGVVEHKLTIKGSEFCFVDVGGQRSERKKWISQFEGVAAMLFLSAINEYDQKLYEDRDANRLQESLDLFHVTVNSTFFRDTSIILFLNKTDLFREKLKKRPISVLFKDYNGPNTYEDTTRFLEKQFENQTKKKRGSSLFIHHTCATDTSQVENVIESVIDSIIQTNLQRSGVFDMS